jgi:hypothetical protein
MCEPLCRASENPIFSKTRHTSLGFSTGRFPIVLSHLDRLRADELSLQCRLAIFQEHPDHFLQISPQFIQRSPLGVSTGETRYVSYIHSSFGALFYHGRE